MKLILSRPEDESLEAYKRWLTDFIKATNGKDPDFSEEHWVDSWKKFWGPEEQGGKTSPVPPK